jgi:hypothetical protein
MEIYSIQAKLQNSQNLDLKSAKMESAIFDYKLKPNIQNTNKYEHNGFHNEQWIQKAVFFTLYF